MMEIEEKPASQYKQKPQSQILSGTYSNKRKRPPTLDKGRLDDNLKSKRSNITSSFSGRALSGDDAMKKKLPDTVRVHQFSSNYIIERKVMPQDALHTPSKRKCLQTSKRWFNELLEANRDKLISPLTHQVFLANCDTVIKKVEQKTPIVIPLGKFPKNFVPMLFTKKNNFIKKREAENKMTRVNKC